MQKLFLFLCCAVVLIGAGCTQKEDVDYISPEIQRMMDAKEQSDQVGGYPEAVPGVEEQE